jgi:hypothetical protein
MVAHSHPVAASCLPFWHWAGSLWNWLLYNFNQIKHHASQNGLFIQKFGAITHHRFLFETILKVAHLALRGQIHLWNCKNGSALIRENVQKHGYHLLLQELGLWPKFTQWICAKHFGSQIDTAQITVHLSSGSACIMDSVAAPLLHSADHAPGPHLGCIPRL